MAEGPGWEIIDCDPAGQELIAAVKAHISSQLTESKDKSKREWFGCRRLIRCDASYWELFNHGWDPAASRLLTERCGTFSEQTANTVSIGIAMEESKKQLPLMKLGLGWLLIYRAIEDELNSEVGFFKMIPNSQKLTVGEAQDISERVSISLKPNQVLVVDGDTVIDWPITGGGLALLRLIVKV